MELSRKLVIEIIEKMLTGILSQEDVGWWAYDLMMDEELNFELGYEKLLGDVIKSLHYFHDTEPLVRQFYPETDEIMYYLVCLKGEEMYQRFRVIHWRV